MPTIHAPYNACLGDAWALVNALCAMSSLSGDEVLLSVRTCAAAHMRAGSSPWGPSIRPKLEEILSVLDVGAARIRLVDEPGNVIRSFLVDDYPVPYLPTRIRWSLGPHRRICHQLSNGEAPERNPRCVPRRLEGEFLAWLASSGMEGARLGLPLGLEECIRVAASSDAFVGMDSGMSHVCHSVGLPVLLYDHRELDKHHPGKRLARFRDAGEAIGLARGLAERPVADWAEQDR